MSSVATTYAAELVDRIRPEAPVGVEKIAETLGLEIEEFAASSFEGALICSKPNHVGTIIVNRSIREIGRKRFTIAHEIGHYVLPHHGQSGSLCLRDELENWSLKNSDYENEANVFASEILLPRSLVYDEVKRHHPTFDLIRDLATRFVTSLTASAYRVVDLSSFRTAIVWSSGGTIRWFHGSEEFEAFVQVRDAVAEGTYAYDCFLQRKVPDRLQSVRADLWLAPSKDKIDYILEHSVYLASYDSVLTLLYLEQPSSFVEDDNALEELDPEEFTLRRRRWPR